MGEKLIAGGSSMAKLLVIGAGPAGLYAASEAARFGFEVTLCEKGKVGDNIRCAEGFFDTLKLLGKPEFGVLFKVEKLIVRAVSTYQLSAHQLNLWMIDRASWQRKLADQLEELGVKVREDSPINPKDLAKLKKEYDFIIDASGAPSVTSRAYGFASFYKHNSGKTVQYTLEGDFSHIGNNLKVGLMPDFWGYYWIFPKSKNLANVGVGNFCSDEKDRLWDRLHKVLEEEGLSGYKIVKKTGGICPTALPHTLVFENILLVGDAAGLTSPFHGGGIDMAIISAKEAVKAIASDWTKYEKNLRAIIENKLKFEGLIVKIWRQRNLEEMDSLIASLKRYDLDRLLANPKLINGFSLQLLEKALVKKQTSTKFRDNETPKVDKEVPFFKM